MTSEPFLAWLPAAGDVPTTEPSSPPPSTVSLVTVKPASSSVRCASSALCPVTVGIGTVVAWLPIAMLTVLAPSTLVPGSGSELITLPIWSASPSVWVVVPILRPALVSSVVASARLSPITRGTVTEAGPVPTDSETVVRLLTWVPAAGSVETTLSISSTFDSTFRTSPIRSPAAVSWLRASDSVTPTSEGTATCSGARGPLSTW